MDNAQTSSIEGNPAAKKAAAECCGSGEKKACCGEEAKGACCGTEEKPRLSGCGCR